MIKWKHNTYQLSAKYIHDLINTSDALSWTEAAILPSIYYTWHMIM